MNAATNHKGQSLLPRAVLQKLHIAKRELALDDDDYRDVLEAATGHRSAKDITPDQVPALQRRLREIGWNGYLLRKDQMRPAGTPVLLKYAGLDHRPGRPTSRQLRMLEARFKNIKGFADIDPDAAFRQFLAKRFGVSHANLLDDAKFEAALSAVKRLEKTRGTKTDSPQRHRGHREE
jgi:hypothetical protein